MGSNGAQPKVLGQVTIVIAEGGLCQLQVHGEMGPWTIYTALKGMTEQFAKNMANLEQQPKVGLPPPGFVPPRC